MSILLRLLTKPNNIKTIFKSAERTFYFRKVKEGCECPEPKPKIVEEKKCVPCSFTNWKPKTPKQIQAKMSKDREPKPPKMCYAGMVLKKPDCTTADIDPFQKKSCLANKPPKKKPPIAKDAPPQALPIADWDSNCRH